MRTRFVSTVFHEMGLGLWCLTPLSTIFQSAGVQISGRPWQPKCHLCDLKM